MRTEKMKWCQIMDSHQPANCMESLHVDNVEF